MKLLSILPSIAACIPASKAFQISRPPPHRAPTNLHNEELTSIDEMCIENVAEFCLHESCDIEEYEALINQLEDQKAYFIRHVANVESLLNRLKDANHPEHDPEEVGKLMESIRSTLAANNPVLLKSLEWKVGSA